MLLYAITDRRLLGETEAERREKLVALAAIWAASGVDFIQIREKDLPAAELAELALGIVRVVRSAGVSTRVLVNARPESASAIAVAAGADGVHLHGNLSPVALADAIGQFREAMGDDAPISVACHSAAEVEAAHTAGATLALFAPVFEKLLPDGKRLPGQGMESLTEACRIAYQTSPQRRLRVLALGGVTLENAPECLTAGAAGIAAIRLFLNEADLLRERLKASKMLFPRDDV